MQGQVLKFYKLFQIDRNNQLEIDYKKLQDNFEKSEYIRN